MDCRGAGFAGVLAYDAARARAVAKVEALALWVIAERLENGEFAV